MAFFDLFRQKEKRLAEISVQKTVLDMNNALGHLSSLLTEQGDFLRRIETQQKETSLQLDELDDFLQNDGTNTLLLEALITIADIIGDFYYYASTDPFSPLFEQAQMMKNAAENAMEAAGLLIIDSANQPFDFRLHSAESTGEDNDIPNAYVIKTLKYGYIYRDEIIRRASVVINKIDKTEKTEEIEGSFE